MDYKEIKDIAGTYVMTLHKRAILRAHEMGFDFSEDDYKWVIGFSIMADLATNEHLMDAAINSEGYKWPITKLFGIPVEIDHHNPDSIQLWENVTNRV
jgi:hypothetical protein